MVAGQVGEGGGLNLESVEPALVEPVTRGLDRQMRDAGFDQVGQGLMQLDRVGRGQGWQRRPIWQDDAERADRGGLGSKFGPELAGEVGDRGLAVGTGDGGDRLRLLTVKAGGDVSKAPARGGIGDQGYPLGAIG